MLTRILLATVAVFVAWTALDFVIHGVILGSSYAATAALWRPMEEMKMPVMWLAVAIAAFCFSAIYGWLIGAKAPGQGLRYGLLYGIGTGVGMGYGMYAVMPVPYSMAFTWFAGTVVEAAVAGLLVGVIVREARSTAGPAVP